MEPELFGRFHIMSYGLLFQVIVPNTFLIIISLFFVVLYQRGFSEALTLRNHETQEFWRHAAIIFGVIFFTRWCLQVNDFLKRMKGEEADTIDPWVRFYQIFSAKLVLEVFGGAGAIW